MTSEDFTGWRTSSHSGGNGACVEVGWRTSSHSGGNGDCVQVAAAECVVGVRDTKDLGHELVLDFPSAAWLSFITTTKSGSFR